MNIPQIKIGGDPDQTKYTDRPVFSPKLADPKVRVQLWAKRRGTNVTEGYFICRQLRYNAQYKPVPDYSSAITSLAMGPDGILYGATSGETVHIFFHSPSPPFDVVTWIARLEGETDCRRSLVWEKDNRLICGTRCTGQPAAGWAGGAIYRITGGVLSACAVQEWGRDTGKVEKLCVPVAGEGIAALVIDRTRQKLYGLSDRSGQFFIYDLESGKLDNRGEVDPLWFFSENLMITPEGTVLTTGISGRIVRYDPQVDKLETLDQALPTYPGRSTYCRIDAWVYEPVAGLFYIGDWADGALMTLNPQTLETVLLGKPTDRIRIRALAAAMDGRVFGMAGGVGDIGQMFTYEPETRQLRNLGLPLATVEERRYGFEFDSAVMGPQGQIYFGESERSSRLFTYFPAHLPPRKSAALSGNHLEHGWMP